MQTVNDFIAKFPAVPIEHVNGLIALAGIVLAIFAIYVVFSVTKERRRR